MLEIIQPYIHWLQANPLIAGLVIFLISLSESLAVVGFLIPGSITMTAIGTLIGAGIFPFWSSMIWAILGAIAGDSCSYWLGYYFKDSIRRVWPFSQYPEWLAGGEAFFAKHGGKSVFFGRFVGPVRAMVPLIAGMMRMQPQKFIIANVTSGILWAPSYLLPGVLIGAASEALEPKVFTHLIIWGLITLCMVWVSLWLIRMSITLLYRKINRWLFRFWRSHKNTVFIKTIANRVSHPRYAPTHVQMNRVLLAAICTGLFIGLAISICRFGSSHIHANQVIYHLMRSIHSNLLRHFMVSVTFLGKASTFIALLAGLFIWFCYLGQWRAAGHWLLLGILNLGSIHVIKHSIHSARPTGLLQTPSGWSFPSGHTELSVSFFGFLAILLAARTKRRTRKAIYWLTLMVCSTIALSRLYLGAHWLTDVIGGALLGAVWTMVFAISYRRTSHEAIDPLPTLILSIFIMGIVWVWNYNNHYDAAIRHYQPIWQQHSISHSAWQNKKQNILPLYRTNYFGQDTQVLNIQWQASFSEIKQYLLDHGWSPTTKLNWLNLLKRMSGQIENKQENLPLMPRFYQDQAAPLTFTKYIKQDQQLLTLHLWDSNYRITKNNQTIVIWVGTLYPYSTTKKTWLHKQERLQISRLVSIKKLARPIFSDLQSEIITKCNSKHLAHLPQCSQVLLIGTING